MLDCNLTYPYRWSLSASGDGAAASLHIYNMQNPAKSITNFERGILDWLTNANVFRVGTEAGGTGVKRLVCIDAFPKAGAPAAGDLPSGTFSVIKDTAASKPWLVYNDGGTIKQTEIGATGGGGGMAIGGSITSATAGSVLFAGAAGVLAQDNANFFWDAAGLDLKIGSIGGAPAVYYTNGFPGLFMIPHGSGNNWFEGNAGNFTLAGYGNFGTGDAVLANLTTGSSNVAIGGFSSAAYGSGITANAMTSGSNNFAIGAGALASCTSGFNNFAVGNAALSLLGTGNSNFAVGNNAGLRLNNDVQNTAIGGEALRFASSLFGSACNGNIAIGPFSLSSMQQGSFNVCIGPSIAPNVVTSVGNDILIGTSTFNAATSSGGQRHHGWPRRGLLLDRCGG